MGIFREDWIFERVLSRYFWLYDTIHYIQEGFNWYEEFTIDFEELSERGKEWCDFLKVKRDEDELFRMALRLKCRTHQLIELEAYTLETTDGKEYALGYAALNRDEFVKARIEELDAE